MNWEQVRADLAAMAAGPDPSWQERWLAGERLRQLGPQFARLAMAGEALAAGVKRCLDGDHRDLDRPAGDTYVAAPKYNLCTHGRHWFEDCEACLDQALHPLWEAWEREAQAFAAIDPTAPWAQPIGETHEPNPQDPRREAAA